MKVLRSTRVDVEAITNDILNQMTATIDNYIIDKDLIGNLSALQYAIERTKIESMAKISCLKLVNLIDEEEMYNIWYYIEDTVKEYDKYY